MSIYKVSKVNDACCSYWRDGVKGFEMSKRFHLVAGWNDSQTPALNNDFWTSDDFGKTWSQEPEQPYAIRHTPGHGKAYGKFWIWGGDHYMDLWSYDDTNGWVQINSNWSVDTVGREHFNGCVHEVSPGQFYAYVKGGHRWNEPANKQNSIYRCPLFGGSIGVWELVLDYSGDSTMINTDSGCLRSFQGKLVDFGGGRVDLGTPYPVNTKVRHSTDGGATWTAIADHPELNSFIWGDAACNDHVMFAISGSDPQNNMTGDNNRIVYSYDGFITLYVFQLRIPGRHATAIWEYGSDFYFACGYNRNDMWRIKRIASDYRCYINIYGETPAT